MKRNLFILILSLFIIDTVNCQNSYAKWEDLFEMHKLNELHHFAKENKVKKLVITVPGFVYSSRFTLSYYLEFSFDSSNYQLKNFKIYDESNYFYNDACFEWYGKGVAPKDMLFEPAEDLHLKKFLNLNDKGEDIYGIKHRFYENKTGEKIHHRSVVSELGDTVFSHWNVSGTKPYYLKLLIFEHNFQEDSQQVISTSYEGIDKNGTFLKEWSFNYDTIDYTNIKKIDENSFEVSQWDMKYKDSSEGGIYLDYEEYGKDKMNQKNWIFSLRDTINISSYTSNPESFPLHNYVKKVFNNSDLKLNFENIVVKRNVFSREGIKLPFRLDLHRNNYYFYNTDKYEELIFISPHNHSVSITNVLKTCIVESENSKEELVECYYLPHDSTFKEKGVLVMQLKYDKNGRIIERIYNQKVDRGYSDKNKKSFVKWYKEEFEYKDNMLVKHIISGQKHDKDLSHIKNLNTIKFKELKSKTTNFIEQKHFIVNPDDMYDIELKDLFPTPKNYAFCDRKVTCEIEYY